MAHFDACFIRAYSPVVEFGLAGQTMHQVDEQVPAVEIESPRGSIAVPENFFE